MSVNTRQRRLFRNDTNTRYQEKDKENNSRLLNTNIYRAMTFNNKGNLHKSVNYSWSSRSLSNVGLSCKNLLVSKATYKRRSRSEGFDSRSRNIDGRRSSWSSRYPKLLKEDSSKYGLKPIWHLRTFNNWAKSSLMLNGVAKSHGNSVIGLDLGCSQGSDLKKWFHCRINHLYLVESNTAAMTECRRRYATLKNSWSNFYDATFIQEDFTTQGLKVPKLVDVISSQLAIHKAFESQEKAENMAWNVSQALKCGGSFVVSLTNASKIIESLRKSPGGKSFGNSVYQVHLPKTLPKAKDIPEFGFCFEFNVGSNRFEEFLVQLPVLKRVMAKHGLILEEQKSFLEMYFSARKDSEQVKCMQKMRVVRYGYNGRDRKRVYLTMSDQEREAASLYDALVFRKIFK